VVKTRALLRLPHLALIGSAAFADLPKQAKYPEAEHHFHLMKSTG
jgi:hypothetical protein